MVDNRGKVKEVITQKNRVTFDHPLKVVPNVLKLPLGTAVGQKINLAQMNDAESEFIRLGFGPKFSVEKYEGQSEENRAFAVEDATTNLNERLTSILPSAMPFLFRLTEVPGKSKVMAVGLVDQYRGFTPIESRGAGVQRLLAVMGALLRLDPEAGHSIVLYDEPETSLHADAQHALRRLLENLGSHPNVQVVYTTHSPAMINNFRPQSIRVLKRLKKGNKAMSVIKNDAFDKNYFLVRSSLGIEPSDSMLYAPITIIVEGKSEVMVIIQALEKLAATELIDEHELSRILSQCHFLDGEGSSWDKMCKFAISQRSIPLVFLDGDKHDEIGKFREREPDVEVITLEQGKEFRAGACVLVL